MLPIIHDPNPILRTRSEELDLDVIISPGMQKLMDDMIETMYDDDGIGLAAPQIGENIRLLVIGKEALKNFKIKKGILQTKKDFVLINPTWHKTARKTAWDTEGCLSIPKTYGKVKRFFYIHVEGLDRHGEPVAFDASKYFARVIQHETDHLNGVLFIDKARDVYTVD
mgnify:CR=1 FL=1|jgi:peptide deformylase